MVPSLPPLSLSDHPLIICSPLSFGVLCLSIKPPISSSSSSHLLPPPLPPHPLSSSSSSCPLSSCARKKKTLCQKNKSLLPPPVCARACPCACVPYLCLPVSLSLSVSLCLLPSRQRSSQQVFVSKNTERGRDAGGGYKRRALIPFSLCRLCSFASSHSFLLQCSFFSLPSSSALSKHSSLIKLLQISLSQKPSMSFFSPPPLLLAPSSNSLAHANTPQLSKE